MDRLDNCWMLSLAGCFWPVDYSGNVEHCSHLGHSCACRGLRRAPSGNLMDFNACIIVFAKDRVSALPIFIWGLIVSGLHNMHLAATEKHLRHRNNT